MGKSRSKKQLTPGQLRSRGWTKSLMNMLLPKPRYRHFNGRSMPVWEREDVQAAAPVLELRDSTGAVQRAETDLRTPLSLSLAPGARSAVLKLYAGACAPVHLLAVGAPLYLDKEGNG